MTTLADIKSQNTYSILILVGLDDRIRRAGGNNIEVPYKDQSKRQLNFRWYDWHSFLEVKFGACSGISRWHVVKIAENTNDIEIADNSGDQLKEFNFMNERIFTKEPNRILILKKKKTIKIFRAICLR